NFEIHFSDQLSIRNYNNNDSVLHDSKTFELPDLDTRRNARLSHPWQLQLTSLQLKETYIRYDYADLNNEVFILKPFVVKVWMSLIFLIFICIIILYTTTTRKQNLSQIIFYFATSFFSYN